MTWTAELDFITSLYGEALNVFEKQFLEQNKKIASLEEEIVKLKEQLQAQLGHRFGKHSERSDNNAGADEQQQLAAIMVSAHTRRKKSVGKLLSTDHLPHYQKIYDLPEHEKICSTCNNSLHFIKQNSTKQVEIVPLRYCVVEHIQMLYGCRHCNTIKTQPKTLAPIPKAMAGASLLADVVINKYQFHQPLYRQSKMMKQSELLIPDNTLGNWMVTLGFALEVLYNAMWCILEQGYLQVDETPVKILEPNKKGYLWTYYAPHIGNKRGLVVFELNETRSGDVATQRLQSFRGLLQTDGYSGYNSLRDREGIVGLGCFTHARRKFSEVVKISEDKTGIAAQMIEKMKPLYALEARMKEMKLNFHIRKRLRQKIAWPIIKEIHHWLRAIKSSVPPKSGLGKAIQYTLKQWPYLITYLRHGQAEIDTNDVENKIRDIALGKKNWLFIGNKDSGIIHAIFYTLLISAVLNDLNPRIYIHYVITKVHELRRGTINPLDLLPHRIDVDILKNFGHEQIEFAKLIFSTA